MCSFVAAGRAVRCFRAAANAASGRLQASVVVLPKHLADDFEAFCRSNPASLPLLYRSQPGDASCPPLARHGDIRTDASPYCVFEGGRLVKTVAGLQSYIGAPSSRAESEARHRWADMVCFYLGCTPGLDGGPTTAGPPVNASMYRTSVPCARAGVFSCPLVVTMRPVPAAALDAAVEASFLNTGAPVHIGDAAILGIQDLSTPDYGDQAQLQPGDVPVFWPSAATAVEAILASKPSLAFSHSPGLMLPDSSSSTTTPPIDNDSPSTKPDPELTPLSFLVSHNPLLYSLASRRTVARIRELEKIIGEDPAERGIKALFQQDELLRSCLALSHSSSVAITTGLPTHYMHSPPYETDGPPGAVAMATMLLSLGKQVTLVTDKRALELNQAIIDEAVKTGVLKTHIPLITFEDNGPDSALDFLCHHGDASQPRFDHLMAIERIGRAGDGNYYNMREVNIKHLVDPIDDLFIAAKNIRGIVTTGIGDGGNELGMGKVKEKVKSLMPKGDLIACDVAADYAITAGVSNWGGYAVACGLYLLHTCPSHRRYLKKGVGEDGTAPEQLQDWTANLPSVDKEESFLATLMRFGIRSGKTAHLAMEVDGLTFHPTHSDMIRRLLQITLGSTSENP
ncbi:D-glutamate cyclase, mitochondrial [Betta splendens]|uniref:D-glutamate cyclase, mitochondrial n=1 Tax=Betta splendens TaxID=158456 RepID=A0A6P7LJC6_BETSP|nr:D-glutamate cyclase, mitochondrial [Betta splendens]